MMKIAGEHSDLVARVPIARFRQELGLTPEESVMYELLLDVGSLPAAQIADVLDIRVQGAYQLAHALVRKGFASEYATKPKEFVATAVDVVLKHRAETQRESLRRIRKEMAGEIYEADREGSDRRKYWRSGEVLIGKEAAYDAWLNEFAKVRSEVLSSSRYPVSGDAFEILQKQVVDRGAKIRHLVRYYSPGDLPMLRRWHQKGVAVKESRAEKMYSLSIFDGRLALLSIHEDTDTLSVVLTDRRDVRLMRQRFDVWWRNARRISVNGW